MKFKNALLDITQMLSHSPHLSKLMLVTETKVLSAKLQHEKRAILLTVAINTTYTTVRHVRLTTKWSTKDPVTMPHQYSQKAETSLASSRDSATALQSFWELPLWKHSQIHFKGGLKRFISIYRKSKRVKWYIWPTLQHWSCFKRTRLSQPVFRQTQWTVQRKMTQKDILVPHKGESSKTTKIDGDPEVEKQQTNRYNSKRKKPQTRGQTSVKGPFSTVSNGKFLF